MRPNTRLRQYRLALEEVLEPGIVAGILQGRDVPGEEWMGTVRAGNNKVERLARRIQNCSSLRSNQSAVRTVCLSMDTSSSSHSIFYNIFCQIIYNYKYRRPFHEQLSCLAHVYLNISNLHSSLGVVNCQISADFVVTVNIICTLSKLVNSCRKSTRLE